MTDITVANAKKLRKSLPIIRELSRLGKDGYWKFMTNFDDTTGAIASVVGAALAGTTGAAFETDTDGTVPALALGSQSGGTGDFTQTIKPPSTLTVGNADLLFPDTAGANDTICLIGATQTLVGKTLTTPTIGSFVNATHTHANAAGGGTISIGATDSTTASTFTVNDGATTPEIIIGGGAGTGNFNISLISPTIGANAIITLPAVTGTLAILGANTFAGAQTFGAGILASGAVANNFSGGTGTFLTSSGANTLSGDVTISSTKTLTTGTGAAVLKGSATFDTTKTLTFGAAAGGTTAPIRMFSLTANKGALILTPANATTDHSTTLTNGAVNGANITITLPIVDSTLAVLGANTFVGAQIYSAGATFSSTVDFRGAITSGGSNPAFDLSGSNGAFKTTTGAVRIGPGTITLSGVLVGTIGASTAAAGSTYADATALPAATGQIYPTTAADDAKGVILHANDKVTGRVLFIGNGVSNKILKVYGPSGAAINGGAGDAAFSSVSGKGVIAVCLSGAGNTWLMF